MKVGNKVQLKVGDGGFSHIFMDEEKYFHQLLTIEYVRDCGMWMEGLVTLPSGYELWIRKTDIV